MNRKKSIFKIILLIILIVLITSGISIAKTINISGSTYNVTEITYNEKFKNKGAGLLNIRWSDISGNAYDIASENDYKEFVQNSKDTFCLNEKAQDIGLSQIVPVAILDFDGNKVTITNNRYPNGKQVELDNELAQEFAYVFYLKHDKTFCVGRDNSTVKCPKHNVTEYGNLSNTNANVIEAEYWLTHYGWPEIWKTIEDDIGNDDLKPTQYRSDGTEYYDSDCSYYINNNNIKYMNYDLENGLKYQDNGITVGHFSSNMNQSYKTYIGNIRIDYINNLELDIVLTTKSGNTYKGIYNNGYIYFKENIYEADIQSIRVTQSYTQYRGRLIVCNSTSSQARAFSYGNPYTVSKTIQLWTQTSNVNVSLQKYITAVNGENVDTTRRAKGTEGYNLINFNSKISKNITDNNNRYKNDNPVQIEAGDEVTYRIRVYNNGTTTANKVEITDTIPKGASFERFSRVSYYYDNYSYNGNKLIINLKDIPAGKYTDMDVVLKFNEYSESKLWNIAKITETIPSNNTTYRTEDGDSIRMKNYAVSLQKVVYAVNGEVVSRNYNGVIQEDYRWGTVENYTPGNTNIYSKHNNPITVATGDRVTYAIKVKNNGTTKVRIAEITDNLPSGLSYYKISRYDSKSDSLGAYRKVLETNGETIILTSETVLDRTNSEKIFVNALNTVLNPAGDSGSELIIYITAIVSEPNVSTRLLRNYAEITELKNSNDIEVDDSTPADNRDADYIKMQDVSISGIVWNDMALDKAQVDYNGIYNKEEKVLSGITVKLYRTGIDEPIATKQTGEDGRYTFSKDDINSNVITDSYERFIKGPYQKTHDTYTGGVVGANYWKENEYYSYYIEFEYDGITYTSTTTPTTTIKTKTGKPTILGDINENNMLDDEDVKIIRALLTIHSEKNVRDVNNVDMASFVIALSKNGVNTLNAAKYLNKISIVGDINGDSKINMADVVELKRYYLLHDVDKNGVADEIDICILRLYFINNEITAEELVSTLKNSFNITISNEDAQKYLEALRNNDIFDMNNDGKLNMADVIEMQRNILVDREFSTATENLEARTQFNKKFEKISENDTSTLIEINYNTKNEDGYIPESNYIFQNDKMLMKSATNIINIGKFEEYQLQHINLGLRGRDVLDFELSTDVYSTQVTVNGVEGEYEYNNNKVTLRRDDLSNNYTYAEDMANTYSQGATYVGESYDQKVRQADIQHNLYEKTGLKINVTYKITVQNLSKTDGTVNSISDFYDKKYDFKRVYYKDNDGNEKNISEVSNETEYSDIYNQLRFYTPEDIILSQNDKMEIYIEFELINAETILKQTLLGENKVPNLPTFNIAEIESYSSKCAEGQTEFTRGLIDKNSAPGSIYMEQARTTETVGVNTPTKNGNPTTLKYYFEKAQEYLKDRNNRDLNKLKYENDTCAAPILYFAVGDADTPDGGKYTRTIKGIVFEDKTLVDATTKIKTGNGKLDDGEVGVFGAKVELIELILDENGNETPIVRYTQTTDKDGNFTFRGFLPGNYIIKYYYGDAANTVLLNQAENGINSKSYNGEDFQSTNNSYDLTVKDEKGNEIKSNLLNTMPNFWYAYNELEGISTAKDDFARRKQVTEKVIAFTDTQTAVLNNMRAGKNAEQSKLKDENSGEIITVDSIIEDTKMFAQTEPMLFTVEKTEIKENNQGAKEIVTRASFGEYIISNMSFGIAEVPVTIIDLQKEIHSFAITDATGTNKIGEVVKNESNQWELKGDILPTVNKGFDVSIEDEKLQGAKLQATYEIKSDITVQIDYDNIYGVKPILKELVDVVDNNLYYNSELNNNSKYWTVTTLDKSSIANIKDYNTILKATDESINLLNNGKSIYVTLEKVLSSTNATIDEIITSTVDLYYYNNIVEITKLDYTNVIKVNPNIESNSGLENGTGDGTDDGTGTNTGTQGGTGSNLGTGNDSNTEIELNVDDILNSEDSLPEYALIRKDLIRTPIKYTIIPTVQHDIATSGVITIHPPTGDSSTNVIYYVLAVVSLAILAVGAFGIKKFVVNSKK